MLHDHQAFASDLAGVDPKHYGKDEKELVVSIYEWLWKIGALFNNVPLLAEGEHLLEGFHEEGLLLSDLLQVQTLRHDSRS